MSQSQSTNSYGSNSYKSSSTSTSRNGTSSNGTSGGYQPGGSNRQQGSSNHQPGSSNSRDTRVPSCPHCTNLNKFSLNKFSQTVLPTDHYLRETPFPDSKLVCPVLLATECRYCKDFGHTVSKCALAAAENKRRELELARRDASAASAASEKAAVKSTIKALNRFSALDSDSDDETTKRSTTKLVKSQYSSRTIIPETSSKKRKRDDEPQFDFPELHTIAVVSSDLIVADFGKQSMNFMNAPMNFMNAIKSQPVVEEPTRVSGLPPMLVAVDANASAVKAKQPSSVKKDVFNIMRSSWADSDSDDEYTECDRQRLADEHKAWMQSKMQTKMQREMQTNIIDVVDESVDSW